MRIVLCALALALAACARVAGVDWESSIARGHPLVGRVWDVAAERFVEPRDLAARLTTSRFVLLGERHDNPDHHALQARVVRELMAAGRRPALAFEMFSTDDAPAIARHLAQHPRDAAGLGQAANLQRTGWDWPLYRPIAQAALDVDAPIVATNLTREELGAIRQRGLGGLEPALMARLKLEVLPTPAMRAAMAQEIRESHCGHAPEAVLDRMIDAQWARDARMAEALARAGERDGAILIAGTGHVRRDRGVPAHLARHAPGSSVASVAFLEVREDLLAPAAYAEGWGAGTLPFDHVWFTPRIDDVDPCEKFRKPLERLDRS